MKTLIIVDPQLDFMPGGALPVPDGQAIVPLINRLLPRFDLVVATQDWHPANHASFAANQGGRKVFEIIRLDGLDQVLWPTHCIQGSPGAAFHPDLDTRPLAAIFRKGLNPTVDSYSGFWDNGHRQATGLAGYLRARQADELYICGLAADICVFYTLADALKEGFKASLIEDASRALDAEQYAARRRELLALGGRVVSSAGL
ncbi:MAG: nicotinamidase [Spirochaetes bacterium GWD1_61_31]|nr:MAG: nicotinamidase [Spirochaetes bacterium GWB1_60_80]OHD34529.1 MAG: nicotinamidase [Spirochaetes bacterium GWC1_61_12]OHD38132.1 MAG: nicotinamidase [Spirochaetes bacterium GWD1_61_31]OHD42974.1 MAG: nicotinamidase [Spirochaetes bacterium GWE1_60_18]OHD58699.1 MAG: nicotinamidase [Spirochaetes bacterium GWF1_60_12]HAP44179.1 bifunctional nicotinamidase/pyrazinamidase [Spirochaetaceae bacterium]